jgi:hypothetical protein
MSRIVNFAASLGKAFGLISSWRSAKSGSVTVAGFPIALSFGRAII